MTTTVTSRVFNQDTGGAKKAAKTGPVVITERGQPSFVLLTYARYEQLLGGQQNIGDLLGCPKAAEIDFELPPREGFFQVAEFD